MARQVRIRVSGGMYHVFTRGHNREVIFCHEKDAEHFLEQVKTMREMFGVRGYAYGLMPNHDHLLLGNGIVRIVERLKKAEGDDFRDKRGDPGRDVVLWAARRYGGVPLRELGHRAGGMDYSAVAVYVLRLLRRSQKDRSLRRLMKHVADQCQK